VRYPVIGSDGPGFGSPEETVHVLEQIILPSFDALIRLEKEGKIVAGGLPVGDRAFVCIVEVSSNEEVDELARNLPMWGALKWQGTALQSFQGRAAKEHSVVQQLKQITR